MLYRTLLRPILFRLPPETAHELVLHFLSWRVTGSLVQSFRTKSNDAAFGELRRFGLSFSNPLGLAGGFDKDGIALPALSALGFGFIEAGTVTLHPQEGNPKPRLFRLPADKALINRAGFNNHGAEAFARNVTKHKPRCVLGISIGKSKVVPISEAAEDYLKSFELVFSAADYIAVNVSSPNTPQLRELQAADQLEQLMAALQAKNRELSAAGHSKTTKPLLVKLAPELEERELEMIVDVARRTSVAGIIATNTTVGRAGLRTAEKEVAAIGAGGLSGAPLRQLATNTVAKLFKLTAGSIPIVGVGGIFTAADAWEKICAGASLIQIYTGLIYEGPAIVHRINEGLIQIMQREGLRSLDEAVGSCSH